MGGKGSGRKPLPVELRKFSFEPKQPIATDMFLPNLSGLKRHREAQDLGGTTYTGTAPIDVTGTVISLDTVDISDKTNLAATTPIVLTGDTLSHAAGTETTSTTYRQMETDSTGHITNALEANTIPEGTSLPSTPTENELFIMDTTGRRNLYYYDGSAWTVLMNLTTTTYYVDAGGTDSPEKGTAGGASKAFATVQYAVDQIGALYYGDLTIYLSGDTFDETVRLEGKFASGNYSINIIGTLTAQETIESATVTAGSGTTKGTFAGAGSQFTGNTYGNLLAYFETDGEYRIIDSHDNTTATLVSNAPSATTQDVTIYDWSTVITSVIQNNGQKNVNYYFLEFENFQAVKFSTGVIYQSTCRIAEHQQKRIQFVASQFTVYDFVLLQNASGNSALGLMALLKGAQLNFQRNKIDGTGGNHTGIKLQENSFIDMRACLVTDCTNSAGGLSLQAGSLASTYSSASQTYNAFKNCTTGILAKWMASVYQTSTNIYSGNTTNESPSGASDPAYID